MVKKSKKKKKIPLQHQDIIDLHGLRLQEAQELCADVIHQALREARLQSHVSFRIITGKGRHSGVEGPVLSKEIHRFVLQEFQAWIVKIDDSPDEVALDGIPVRGHFDLILKK